MKRKVELKVYVTISVEDEATRISQIEGFAATHTRNCLLDNPDVDMYSIEAVDVTIENSKEV